MGDSQEKSCNPPPPKSRQRKTSHSSEYEKNDLLKQLSENIKALREENLKLSENLQANVKRDIQTMKDEMMGEVNNLRKTLDDVVVKVKTEVRAEVRAEISVVEKQVESLHDMMSKNERSVVDVNEKLLKQASLTADICDDICSFNNLIERMGEKLIDQESRGRRSNLLFHGIPEEFGEACKEKICQLIIEHCKIPMTLNQIQRAHRIGGEKVGKIRPLIVLFVNWSDKEAVREKRKSLPEGIYCTNDVPYEVRQAKKSLQPDVAAAHARGDRCHVAFPARLIVNGREVKRVTPRYEGFSDNRTRTYYDAPSTSASSSANAFRSAGASARGDERNAGRQNRFNMGDVTTTDTGRFNLMMTSDVGVRGAAADVNRSSPERMDDTPAPVGAEGGGPRVPEGLLIDLGDTVTGGGGEMA